MSNIQVRSDLSVAGALVLSNNLTEFPSNPAVGTLVIKDQVLYCYLNIGDLETWYPFSQERNSYVHIQAIANATWTVNHNLGSDELFYQVQDATGNITSVGITKVNNNSFTVNFTTPETGIVVVVAPGDIIAPTVKASVLEVGGGYVTINGSGVFVDGEPVLTEASLGDAVDDAVAASIGAALAPLQSEIDAAEASIVTLQGEVDQVELDLAAETAARQAAITSLSNTVTSVQLDVADLEAPSGVTAGTYRSPTVAVNERGVITSAQDVGVITSMGGGTEINCALGSYFKKTVNGDVTFSFANAPTGLAFGLALEVDHLSGTIGWPGSVVWPRNEAPVLTPGTKHLFIFITSDNGTTWRGASAPDYPA